MFKPSIVSNLTAINGRSYANLEGLNMCQGDAVAWHILAVGANEALHGIKFNGNNILTNGVNRDSYIAVPGGTFTGLMHAENVGMYPVFRNTSVINIKKKLNVEPDAIRTKSHPNSQVGPSKIK